MEYGMQKKLSMLIRANELKHTLSFYNSPYSCNTFKTYSFASIFVNKKDANVSKAHEDFYNVIILGADYAE